MPEAPQIRLIVSRLQPFVGKKILKATALTNELDLKRLEGLTIKDITAFGKQILILLPSLTVRIHLMLFGYIRINERKEDGKLRLGLQFADGEANFYASDIEFLEQTPDELFDPTTDVMDPRWDEAKALKKLRAQADEMISDVLIDQEIFNGLGNKGVNESLYRCKVHPGSVVAGIPAAKLKQLVKEVVEFSFDYLEWESRGIAKDKFSVYLRKKCPVHQTPLKHEKVGHNGRKCHFCEECQIQYN